MGALKERSTGLDFVRCLAVAFVLICHGSLMIMPWFGRQAPLQAVYAGTYGVTLFCVLSGFLIGRILIRLSDRPCGWRDWLAFMRRRWTRTLPLYGIWLAVLAAFWPPHALDADHAARLRGALPWFVTMTQNLAWPMRQDWFGVSWSLCVEEWFYLLFSAALLLGGAWLGRRAAFWLVLGAFLLVPPLLRVWLPGWDPAVHSDTGIVLLRLDSVGYGVLVAWLSVHFPAVGRYRFAWLGCGLGLVAAVLSGALGGLLRALGHWGDAATLMVLPLGFALCLPAATAATDLPAWLRLPIQAISNQSYGIYLCHLSILEWVNYELWRVAGLPPLVCLLVVVLAVWTVSFLSFRYIEMPLLSRRPRPRFAPEGKLARNRRWSGFGLGETAPAGRTVPALPHLR
jgi:peptidoglycan/LPS O-acetylase OafA/YrhL